MGSKRMTDEEFYAEIDELDRTEQFSLAMLRAAREAIRARAEEVRKDGEITRLRAALKRIEDEAHERGVAWAQRVAKAALKEAP